MLFCFTRRNRNGTPPSFVGTGRSKPESHWKSKGSHLASNQLALLRLVRVLGRMRTSSMFRGRAGEKQTVVLLMKHDSISYNVRRIERIFFFFVRGGAFFFLEPPESQRSTGCRSVRCATTTRSARTRASYFRRIERRECDFSFRFIFFFDAFF